MVCPMECFSAWIFPFAESYKYDCAVARREIRFRLKKERNTIEESYKYDCPFRLKKEIRLCGGAQRETLIVSLFPCQPDISIFSILQFSWFERQTASFLAENVFLLFLSLHGTFHAWKKPQKKWETRSHFPPSALNLIILFALALVTQINLIMPLRLRVYLSFLFALNLISLNLNLSLRLEKTSTLIASLRLSRK